MFIKKIIYALAILVFSVSLQAVELPLNTKYQITIENGEFTVFEFPFEIKKTFSSGFLLNKDSDEIKKLKEENSKIVIDPRTKQQVVKKDKIIQIKQGKKSITFLPKARGSFKIVIWGYKEYPLMFDMNVIDKLENDENEIQFYYKFLDYSKKEEKAKDFESVPHEKVIVKLLRAIYDKKIPSGYESVRRSQEFEDEVFSYLLNFSYVGKRYTVEEWLIQNKSQETIKLYEEQFIKKNVFGVSFESDLIEPLTTTRLFIVRKSTKGDY